MERCMSEVLRLTSLKPELQKEKLFVSSFNRPATLFALRLMMLRDYLCRLSAV